MRTMRPLQNIFEGFLRNGCIMARYLGIERDMNVRCLDALLRPDEWPSAFCFTAKCHVTSDTLGKLLAESFFSQKKEYGS